MLRICLILAIVVALASLVVSQSVSTTLKKTKDDLESTQGELSRTQGELARTRTDEREARLLADTLRNERDNLQLEKEELQQFAQQQQNRADDFENRYKEAVRTKNEVQDELALWRAFDRTPQEIDAVLKENTRLTVDMAAISQENLVWNREVQRLKNRLRIYEGEDFKVELPADLKGQVTAVDPKFDFVVLDIGTNDGVLERGEMLVSRSGKLVAKVRIMSVRDQTCVANVLADWKQADIMEGDLVSVGL